MKKIMISKENIEKNKGIIVFLLGLSCFSIPIFLTICRSFDLGIFALGLLLVICFLPFILFLYFVGMLSAIIRIMSAIFSMFSDIRKDLKRYHKMSDEEKLDDYVNLVEWLRQEQEEGFLRLNQKETLNCINVLLNPIPPVLTPIKSFGKCVSFSFA